MNIRNMDACYWMDDKSWYKLVGNSVVLTELAPPEMVESFEKWLRIQGYASEGYPVMNDKLFEFLASEGYDRENYDVQFLCNYHKWSWFHIRKIESDYVWHFPVILKVQKDKYKFASEKKIFKFNKFLKKLRHREKKAETKIRVKCAEFDSSIPPKLYLTEKAFQKDVKKLEKLKLRNIFTGSETNGSRKDL